MYYRETVSTSACVDIILKLSYDIAIYASVDIRKIIKH